MPTSLEKLYAAGSRHYELGDIATFQRKMQNPESRQKFYNALSQFYDLGDYDTYNLKVTSAYGPTGAMTAAENLASVAEPRNGNGGQQAARPPSQTTAMLQNPDILEEEIERRLQGRLQPPQSQNQQMPGFEEEGYIGGMGKEILGGLAESAAGAFTAVGSGATFLRKRFGLKESATEVGAKKAQDYFLQQAEKYKATQEYEGKNLWDNPELLFDPKYLAFGTARMIPSMALAMIPGAAALRYGKAAAAIVGGASGGLLEGVNTYRETLERGGTTDEAFENMMEMTLGSGLLNAIGLGKIFGKAAKGKRLIKVVADALVEGITEYLEEPTELAILAHNVGLQPGEVTQRLKNGLSVIGPAMIMGGGGSAVSQYLQRGQEQAAGMLEDAAKRTGDPTVAAEAEQARKLAEAIREELPTAEPEGEFTDTDLEAELAEIIGKEPEGAVTPKPPVEPERLVEPVAPETIAQLDAAAGALDITPEVQKELLDMAERAKSRPDESAWFDRLTPAEQRFIRENSPESVPNKYREAKVTAEAPVVEPTAPPTAELVETKPIAEETAEKQPWEMTRQESINFWFNRNFANENGEWYHILGSGDRGSRIGSKEQTMLSKEFDAGHKVEIEDALKQGKPIPPEVLAEYPDLAEKYGKKELPEKSAIPVSESALERARENFANISIDRVEAKKRPDGQWQLFWRGTKNEVFPNESYATAMDARNAFKVQKTKDQQAVVPKMGTNVPELGTVPDIPLETKPVALILPKSGNPYKTQQAAQRKVNELGKDDYEIVPHNDGYAVRPRRVPTKAGAVRPITEIPKTRQEVELTEGLAKFAKGFHIPVEINESPYDLPREGLTQAVLNEGARGNRVLALYDAKTGKVHMLTDNIVDIREGIIAATHDIVGHAGIQQMLGEVEFNRFIKNLLKDKRISPVIRQLAQDNDWSPEYAAGEWFAEKAERESWNYLPHSLKDRVIFWLKQALRRLFGANRVSFSNKEIEQLLRDSYQYAKSNAVNEAIEGGEATFKTQNIRVLKEQLNEVYRALRTLPETRYGQPTGALQQRLLDKVEELEKIILNDQTAEERVPFSSKPTADARLQKKIAALEKGIPEKDKDVFARHRLSTLIKREISALKKGHRLGQLDLRQALLEPKQLILEYARKYLPKDDMTKGMVSPLLTQAMRATTPEEVASTFERIDNIGRRVSMKQMRGKFLTLLKKYKPKVKDSKITGPTLTADEYRVLGDIRTVMTLSEEEVQGQIDRIAASVEARNKVTGLRQEPDGQDAEAIYLLSTFGNIKGKDQRGLKAALEELQAIITEGRSQRRAKDEARQAIAKERIAKVLGIIGEPKSQEEIAAQGKPIDPGKLQEYLYENLSLEYLFDELSKGEIGADPLRGYINSTFMPLIRAARNAETAGVRAGILEFQQKATEIWGTTDTKELGNIATRNSIIEDTGIKIVQNDKLIPLLLSQEQAYKKWQEWQDPTLRETFEQMGYTQDVMNQLEAWINPEVKAWADWQIYEWYPKYYHTVNAVFREVYNVDLPYNPMYTPLSRVYDEGYESDDQMLTSHSNYFTSVRNKHLLTRTKNTRALKNIGGDSALINHLVEMEHFKAWAEPMRQLRAVFGDGKVRASIRQNFGAKMGKIIDDALNDMARGGVDPRQIDKLLDKLRRNFTTAVLGINLTMIPKQLSSFVAYWGEIPTVDFFGGMADLMTNPVKKVKILMQSEMMKARYDVGFERDIMLAMQRSQEQQISGARGMRDTLMFATKIGDAWAIFMGGWSVYRHHLNKALKAGKSRSEAEKIAMNEFEAATLRSQQAGNVEDLPALMRSSSLMRLFTMFQTSPNSYFRIEYSALANLARGRGAKSANIRKFAVAHFVLPMFFQWVANFFQWDKVEQTRAAILGSLNGLLIIGDFLERGVKSGVAGLMGGKAFIWNGAINNPVFDNAADLTKVVTRMTRQMNKGGIPWKDIAKTVDMLAEVVSKVLGYPYSPVARTVEGAYEAATTGETHWGKLLGYSEYALTPTITEKQSVSRSARRRPSRALKQRERIGR